MEPSDYVNDSIGKQKKMINTIHMILIDTFENIFKTKEYNILLEKRTFNENLKTLTINIEQLVEMNLNQKRF